MREMGSSFFHVQGCHNICGVTAGRETRRETGRETRGDERGVVVGEREGATRGVIRTRRWARRGRDIQKGISTGGL
jgi:hypothetical protein